MKPPIVDAPRYRTSNQVIKRNCLLTLSSIILTFVILRIWLSIYPNTDLNVGKYNIHHLFSGLLLIMIGGIPLALFRGSTYRLDIAVVIFGVGMGMTLDEWVFMIATDGTNMSYLLPVSFWGGLIAISLACAYAIFLTGFRTISKND